MLVSISLAAVAHGKNKSIGPRMAFYLFAAVAHGFVFGLDGESLKRTSFPVHIFVVRRGMAGGSFGRHGGCMNEPSGAILSSLWLSSLNRLPSSAWHTIHADWLPRHERERAPLLPSPSFPLHEDPIAPVFSCTNLLWSWGCTLTVPHFFALFF